MKITFVILHYQNVDDTINCIESIKRLENKSNIEINTIIIDNKSPNGSGETLISKYANIDKIKVILLDKNYGFSKANNIGYKEAIKAKTDIILVLNNDIIFEDLLFLEKLEKIYNLPVKYDIICPDIINADGMHQNPLRERELPIKKAYKNLIYESIFSISMNFPCIRKLILDNRLNREKKWFENYYKTKNEICNEHFVPFGAFIIYMNKWLDREEVAFVSDTFMYCEEDMLSIHIKKNNYKILYAEELKVKHLEGQSTKKSNKNDYERWRFRSRNQAKALIKYIRYYKDNKEVK